MSLRTAWKGLVFCSLFMLPQGVKAECPLCSESATCQGCGKCFRNNHFKIINKRNLLPAPPPAMVVGSTPFITVGTSAIAISPASFSNASFNTGAASAADIRQIVADEMRRQGRASAAAPAAADDTCDDVCGDIKQLQSDLKQLIKVTDRLSKAVKVLSDDYESRHPDAGN